LRHTYTTSLDTIKTSLEDPGASFVPYTTAMADTDAISSGARLCNDFKFTFLAGPQLPVPDFKIAFQASPTVDQQEGMTAPALPGTFPRELKLSEYCSKTAPQIIAIAIPKTLRRPPWSFWCSVSRTSIRSTR
jgi:hypothetical protein